MLTLNLISENLKNEIKMKHYYRTVKKINFTILSILIIAVVCIFSAKLIMQKNYNNVLVQASEITTTNKSDLDKAREINSKISAIYLIQSNYSPFSLFYEYAADIAPQEISFSFISINKENGLVKMTGTSKTRSALLDFKEKLENLKFLKNTDFPLKNILRKENIDFEITSTFDFNEFNNFSDSK